MLAKCTHNLGLLAVTRSIMFTPCKLKFYHIKADLKGLNYMRTEVSFTGVHVNEILFHEPNQLI